MSDSTKDFVLAMVLLALSVLALAVLARTRSGGEDVANVVGFATLPRLYALLLAGLSILLAAGALIRNRREARGLIERGEIHSVLADRTVLMRMVGAVGLLVLYVIGLQYLSFLPTTIVFLAAMFLLYGRRPLWAVGLVAVLGGAALDIVFIRIIDLPLH